LCAKLEPRSAYFYVVQLNIVIGAYLKYCYSRFSTLLLEHKGDPDHFELCCLCFCFGQSEAKLLVPATYVINPKGEIVFRHFDYDYKNRASVNAMLAALDL
jgi:hypothetical protein